MSGHRMLVWLRQLVADVEAIDLDDPPTGIHAAKTAARLEMLESNVHGSMAFLVEWLRMHKGDVECRGCGDLLPDPAPLPLCPECQRAALQ